MTWDSKITTVLAAMGGNRDIIRDYLIKTNRYNAFIAKIESEYSREFTKINGEFVDIPMPSISVKRGRPDFPNCKA